VVAVAGALWGRSRRLRAAGSAPSKHIGLLYGGSLSAFLTNDTGASALAKGLASGGYVEGSNLKITYRAAESHPERLRELAEHLVSLKVDLLIVPGSMQAVLAAKAATRNIPIVYSNAGDPLAAGIVKSLSVPGGNITGITDSGMTLSAKRLELLKRIVPGLGAVAILRTPNNPVADREMPNAQEGAQALGISLSIYETNTLEEIKRAFNEFGANGITAFYVIPSSLFLNQRAAIVELSVSRRLPGVYPLYDFVRAGGLLSYGSSLLARNYETGVYAARVLNGQDPSTLPVERLLKFELAINLAAARQLGLSVDPRFILLADRVLE